MKVFNILTIILCQLTIYVTAFDLHSFYSPSVNEKYSAICVPVRNTNGNAFVKVNGLSNGNDKDKIPILIVHLTEMLKVSSFPRMSQYNRMSIDDKLKLTNDKGFIIDTQELNEEDYVTTMLENGKSLKFEVKDSGYYCVYIAPSKGTKVDLPIIYHSSSGYLTFTDSVYYRSSLFFTPILIGITGYLFNYLMKSTGSDFQNLDSVSVVSKTIVFGVLLPYVFVTILDVVKNMIFNNISEKGFLSALLGFSVQLIHIGFNIYLQYVVLLFCMGYGVLYYHKPTKSYREIPKTSFKFANNLLYFGLVLFGLLTVNSLLTTEIPATLVGLGTDDSPNVTASNAIGLVLTTASVITFLVSYIASLIYGWKTLKTMKDYPTYSSNVEGYVEKNDAIRKAFKRSIVLIFVLPVYVGIILGSIMVFTSTQPLLDKFGSDIKPELIMYYMNDMFVGNPTYLYYLCINDFVLSFAIVVGIFFIWLRKNEGLVVDKEEELGYTGFHDEDEPVVV